MFCDQVFKAITITYVPLCSNEIQMLSTQEFCGGSWEFCDLYFENAGRPVCKWKKFLFYVFCNFAWRGRGEGNTGWMDFSFTQTLSTTEIKGNFSFLARVRGWSVKERLKASPYGKTERLKVKMSIKLSNIPWN